MIKDEYFQEVIDHYLPDSDTWVYCLTLSPTLKQVIEIDNNTGGINHYEDESFENIFRDNFAHPLTENIDIYDYMIYEYYPWLAKWLLDNISSVLRSDCKAVKYTEYVADWWNDHDCGNPVCFDEWEQNEFVEND